MSNKVKWRPHVDASLEQIENIGHPKIRYHKLANQPIYRETENSKFLFQCDS